MVEHRPYKTAVAGSIPAERISIMESLLVNFSEIHRFLAYAIIFLAVLIEGEIILLLAGVLSRNGYLDIFDAITVAFAAAIIHDLIYWQIGKKLFESNRKRFLFINLEKTASFLERLKVNDGLYIFISKFAWSFNKVILVASGYLQVPLKELLRYSWLAALIWSITFVSLGSIFAYKTDILKKDLKIAALFIISFIAVIIIFENIIQRMIKKI